MDGSQDFNIKLKIKTENPMGSILVRAETAAWGGFWKDGGSQGQGKMLFLRDGKLCFDICWVGLITGQTNIADGKEHEINLIYMKTYNKFRLIVDG